MAGGLAPYRLSGLTPPGPEGSNGNPLAVVMWHRRATLFLMSYIVLARKYRPRQFQELVGQQHVATTLLNSFRQNKLGQAYLLTGTRGVGKTSVARIFAKALRCEDPDSQPGGKHPGQSCDKCPSCLEIHLGASLDVLEIDGASNNGVENVREIREQVKFLPSHGRMKVYIIDEVHMLTNAAFNALLKTLEEPPPHVTFIMATTESQKIPPTILSRCQRFDFRRVPQPLIQDHLLRITQLEGIQAEPGTLRLIARKADGSVRDGLSALDQCLALGGRQLTIQGVTESLGIVSTGFLLKILTHTFRRELLPAATLLQEAFVSGVEMKQVALGLAETLRNALFVKLGADASLTEISDEEKKDYLELVGSLAPETIQAGYRLITQSLEEILRSPLPRASTEMALARLSGIGHLKSLEDFLQAGPVAGEKKSPRPEPEPTPRVVAAPSSAPSLRPNAPVLAMATAKPASAVLPSTPTFKDFIAQVLQQKPALGSLLEHAIAVTPEEKWPQATEIKLGFRKSHAFYQMQAQHKANFDKLEQALRGYLQRETRLMIETIAGETTPSGPASVVEIEKKEKAESAAEKRSRFLAHEIVRDTKEIFGAELSSFDIDKARL